MHTPHTKILEYTQQKLREPKGEINKSTVTILLGAFNITLTN